MASMRRGDQPELAGLEVGAELALEGTDRRLVAPVESPLPDAFRRDEVRSGEGLEVGGGGRLGDAKLVGDEDHANAVVDQVSVALRREVGAGIAEPFEDLETLRAGEGAKDLDRVDCGRGLTHLMQIRPCIAE